MLSDEHLLAYVNLFINRTDIWLKQYIRDGHCSYFHVKPEQARYEPVTADLLTRHLQGKLTASWSAIDAAGRTKWMAWDADTDTGDIERIAKVLAEFGLQSHREAVRPGRDGHLWVFFDCSVLAADAIRFNEEVMRKAECTGAVEFFPKYPTAISGLRGPLGIHRKPGADNCRGWFEDAAKNLDAQLDYLSAVIPQSGRRVANLGALLRAADARKRKQLGGYVCRTDFPGEKIDGSQLIQMLPSDVRRQGHEQVAQCPVCAAEGHDKSRDNLKISPNGEWCCTYGGPGKVHKQGDILRSLRGV